LSRLNPLNEVTQPMARLEAAMKGLQAGMTPVETLPEVLASLQRVEGLLERLLLIQEAEAQANGFMPVRASGRGGPRKRAASA
jgi:hypothetical protein